MPRTVVQNGIGETSGRQAFKNASQSYWQNSEAGGISNQVQPLISNISILIQNIQHQMQYIPRNLFLIQNVWDEMQQLSKG